MLATTILTLLLPYYTTTNHHSPSTRSDIAHSTMLTELNSLQPIKFLLVF